MPTIRRVAMLSMHTCPLANLGGRDTGGMNVYVRELSREFARRAISVDVFTRLPVDGAPTIVEDIPGVRVIHLPAGPVGPVTREVLYHHIPGFADEIGQFRDEQGISYDLVHAHYWLSGLVGLQLRRMWNVPVITMFHTLARVKHHFMGGLEAPGDRLRSLAEQHVIDGVDRIVAANTTERDHILTYYRADPEKIAVSPLGVDPSVFFPRERQASKQQVGATGKLVVFCVGRMEPLKGIDVLLRAIARLFGRDPQLRDAVQVVIGGGPSEEGDTASAEELARLRGLTDELGLASVVRFTGALSQRQLPLWYGAADLCVVPSFYESFGLVAIEAMASGTPVIASDVGGLALTVRDGVNGLLVPPGDDVRLAEQLGRLLCDHAWRERLGKQAEKSARQYRWSVVADRVLEIYQTVGYEAPSERSPIETPARSLCASCSG